ncbi:circadian clock-controlled protein daywake-like [Galleria mellonella]|uniref:Circadian clock-controlled protein daywake-like n=1 Tax=Galleria mellonella TaxID=7137 RepID=A0A6J3C309_GALME|nr:circadian clock-controlled protein daywake-like [Galleria mellonella]
MTMLVRSGIIVALCLIVPSLSFVLPVEKCRLDDSKCLTQSFQNGLKTFMEGMPELGTDVLDVMEMEDIEFDLSGLQFALKGGHLKGLKNSIIDQIVWDTKKKVMEMNFRSNNTLNGHYKANGRILILPISGDGELKLKLRDVQFKVLINYILKKGSDGKDRVVPKKYEFVFEVLGNAHFELTNLFNGNKELSDSMHIFLNDNWKEISTEFGRPIIDAGIKKMLKNIAIFFDKNPIDDISIQ